MNTTAANIEVIQRRVKLTHDYSAECYEGDRPNLNWTQFLLWMDFRGKLSKEPRLKLFRKTTCSI
jgi:hypothetical protein